MVDLAATEEMIQANRALGGMAEIEHTGVLG